MKVVHLVTDDSRGGAVRAGYRLHASLYASGVHSLMLVKRKGTADPTVVEHSGAAKVEAEVRRQAIEEGFDGAEGGSFSYYGPHRFAKLVQDYYINRQRTKLTNTIFSFGNDGFSCEQEEAIQKADVINLHWITGFLTPASITKLIALGKPIVWTFHDQWGMTGGCHYTAGCRQFQEHCTSTCPQLQGDPNGLVPASFDDRREVYGGGRITVVAPSHWMAGEVRSSRIFRDSRVEVIPYGLDLNTFSPLPKADPRREFNLPEDAIVFLFACSSAHEQRKGVHFLAEGLKQACQDPRFEKLRVEKKIWLLFIGWSTEENLATGLFPERHLGFVAGDAKLRGVFSAADALINLSTEDNLPNMVLEAMACGTAVIGFDAGGVPEMIVPGETGELAPVGDVPVLAQKMVRLAVEPGLAAEMGRKSRARMEAHFSPKLQVDGYVKLYEELLAAQRPSVPETPHHVDAVLTAVTARSAELAIKEEKGRFAELTARAEAQKAHADQEKETLINAVNEAAEQARKRLEVIHEKDKQFSETLMEKDDRYAASQRELQNYLAQIMALQDEIACLNQVFANVETSREQQLMLRDDQIVKLKRHAQRLQRNIGYKIAHGITKALKSLKGKKKEEAPVIMAPQLVSGDPLYRQDPLGEPLLAFIDQFKRDFRSVLFLSPSKQNFDLHVKLARAGLTQSVLQEGNEWLQRGLVFAICRQEPIDIFLVHGYHLFSVTDLIVIDLPADEHRLAGLKGRLLPHQRLLIHGPADALNRVLDGTEPHQKGDGFAFYYAPPKAWLTPWWSAEPRPVYGRYLWKSPEKKFASTMPSGRPWPKITVVTPAFKHGHYIEDTIRSVLDQGYPNLEYLVLDGGSPAPDKTVEILDRYRSRLAYAVSEKDTGQANAINKGFTRGTGDIMCWVNSDDRLGVDSLMRVALTFDAFPDADVVSGGCALVIGDQTQPFNVQRARLPFAQAVPLPIDRLLNLEKCWLAGDFFYQPEVFWRRRIWNAVGAYVTDSYFYSFDYELWCRMAIVGGKIVRIPDTLAIYRVHENQKTYGDDMPYMPEMRKINGEMREIAEKKGLVEKVQA